MTIRLYALAACLAPVCLASTAAAQTAEPAPEPPEPPASAAPAVPTPTPTPAAPAAEPFAFADFSWAPGNYGSSDRPLKYGPFTGEVRIDAAYHYDFNHPTDNTISGSSEVFRHNEL